MLKYRCSLHNIDLETSACPECGNREHVINYSDLFWCDECNVPIYESKCPVCGEAGRRIASDIRPVFPEERLLLEIIWGEPFKYIDSSIWGTSASQYIIDGRIKKFSVSRLAEADVESIRKSYEELADNNSYDSFNRYKDKFVQCNCNRFNHIDSEAIQYVLDETAGYDARDMFVSFSGGKDSTVTSDIVMRALSNSKILHIFGDTTLEFPETYHYVEDIFKKEHSGTPVLSSRNKDKDFNELCNIIGPPSRVMRWCCTIFKTGSITRKIESLFANKTKIIAFYGIRRSESASRSKYERTTGGRKITRQITLSPIIDWMDFDVWLYMLTTGIEFNPAYRKGYTRVGCWCCPNNSSWSEFLSKIHMHEQYEKWHGMLVNFAKSIGKEDAEVYVDTGKWKARQGGNGVAYASKSVVSFAPCALEENSFNYDLQRPIDVDLYELFKPFGYIDKTLGIERLGEVFIVNQKQQPIIKLQGRIGTTHLKISILDYRIDGASNIAMAEEKIKCQLTKYQMCIGCRACESVCRHGAIKIMNGPNGQLIYRIDDNRCKRCAECVNHFSAGCYMRKVLATKK